MSNLTLNDTYTYISTDVIELHDFDRDKFMQVMVVYAAPCAVALLAGTLALFHARFHVGLVPSWLLRDWLGYAVSSDASKAAAEMIAEMAAGTGPIAENADQTFEFYLAWLFPAAMFLVLLVPVAIIIFFIAALILLDRMFAVAMAYIFFIAMLLTWTMMRWKFEAWRFTFKVKLLFGFAMATMIAFELYKTYYAKPYTFIGLGCFCLMCNMLGMIRLAYYTREFKSLQFDKYLDIEKPVLQDLKKQEEDAAMKLEQQKQAALEKRRAEAAEKRKQQLLKAQAALTSSDTSTTAGAAAVTDDESKDDSSKRGGDSSTLLDSHRSLTEDEIETVPDKRGGLDVSQLASSQHFQARLSLSRALISYSRALLALAGYAVIIDFAGFRVIGYVTAGAIVWLDIVVLCWNYGQPENTPLQACLLLSLIRFFMIIFGPDYYLVGHTCLFIFISCYFSSVLIDRFAPLSKLRQRTDDEDEIPKEGIAPILVQAPTAVKIDPIGTITTRKEAAKRLRREQRRAAHEAAKSVNTSFTQLSALFLLVVAFAFDIVLNWSISHVQIPSGLYTSFPQYIVGFLGIFVWIVYATGKLTFRIYVNQQYKSHGYPQFLSLVLYVFILGCGAAYYYVNSEKNIPSLCIFLPPIVYFLIGLYSQWVKNDFHIILPPVHRNPPHSSCGQAFMRCGFPGNDYFMVWGIAIEIALIILFGFALSWYITPWWVGAIVSWVLVVLITTITPMVEYFHTFEFSFHMYVMIGLSIVSFFIGEILIEVIVLNGEASQASFMLLLGAFLYPILITFACGLAKWHDDEWQISNFVVWTNFISGMLLILMFFSIALVFTPWWIGGGLMFVFIIILLALMLLPKLKELSPVYYKLTCTAAVILMFGFIIGATLNDSSGFIGFTVLCAICFLGLLGVVYYAYKGSPYDSISIHKHKIVIYSDHIFPIYEFDTLAKGKTQPLTEVNHRVWSIYGIFGIWYVWGVFALFFIGPTTVGLTVSSLAIVGAMIFTSELLHRSSVRNDILAETIDYLEEGSETYDAVLKQCKWIATKNQLLNDTSLFLSTKQNRFASEIGILQTTPATNKPGSDQADAPTPSGLELEAQRSIIAHLEHIYLHQNWQVCYARYEELNHRLAKWTCCGIREDFDVLVDNRHVSRREAFRLCDALFVDSTAFYQRHLLYHLNLQQELIKVVEGKKYDRLTQIIAMLRDKGNFTVTIEYLQSLSPLTSEMQQYELDVDLWLEKRAALLLELARIKAERDEDQRRRDALALAAAENARLLAIKRAADELAAKKAEMEAAEKARQEEKLRLEKQQAEELAEFERQQQKALEEEQQRAEQERLDELRRQEEEAAEAQRVKDEQDRLRQEQEAAEAARLAAEREAAIKEQERLARMRRKLERKKKELERQQALAEEERLAKEKAARAQAKKEAKERALAEKRKKDEEEEAELEKRRAEEAERQHQAEEAERLRLEEEKEKFAEAERAQAAELAALAAAEAEARERAEAKAAEDARRKEEQEERARAEAEEAERKRVEAEEALKAAEKEREAKKAQRKKELAEAKEKKLAQLEAKRLDKLAQEEKKNKAAMEKLVKQAEQDQCCTFKITEQQLVYQEYWSCKTCGDERGGHCFCFACAAECHSGAGHEIEKIGTGPCFCDCGHAKATCIKMKTPTEQKAFKAKQQVTPDHAIEDEQSGQVVHAMDEENEHPCVQILKDCKARGVSWTDPDFPHNDSALFGGGEVLHPEWQGTKWARIKDICKEPTVFLPPIDANDIRQGSLGNCWFMSACAVLTQKPESLMAVFVTKEYNPEGVYGLRFFKNGKVANVTVDDWLPIQSKGPNHIDTLFSKPKDSKAVWVMLIEKAFAKLHKSYQNIEGGWIDDALVDLAGGVADRIRWTDEKTKTALHDGSLWTMLLKYYQQGFLLGCGSPVGASDSEADASPWGIVQSHAYSILSLVAVDGIQLIQVRNPWGRVEWTGDWGDKSPLWTRRMKTKVNYVDRDDGAFFMSWQDFVLNFDEIYVARFYAEALWPSRGKVYGEWRGPTAGGCMNHETVKNNIQYGLTVLEPGSAEISVTLLQEDVRGVEGKIVGDFPVVILEVYDHGGKPVNRFERGTQLASSCDNLQEIFVECVVETDGSKTFTILPCCFEAGVETTYTLSWYCTKRAKFQQFQSENTQDLVVTAKVAR